MVALVDGGVVGGAAGRTCLVQGQQAGLVLVDVAGLDVVAVGDAGELPSGVVAAALPDQLVAGGPGECG